MISKRLMMKKKNDAVEGKTASKNKNRLAIGCLGVFVTLWLFGKMLPNSQSDLNNDLITNSPPSAQQAIVTSVPTRQLYTNTPILEPTATIIPLDALTQDILNDSAIKDIAFISLDRDLVLIANVNESSVEVANRIRALARAYTGVDYQVDITLDDGQASTNYHWASNQRQWNETRIEKFTEAPPATSTPTDAPISDTAPQISTSAPVVKSQSPKDYWATGASNMRSCASTDCEVVGQLSVGQKIKVIGSVDGEAVNSGNSLWYQVEQGGKNYYVYSGVLSPNQPVAAPAISNPVQPSGQQPNRVPKNCTEAVAMGLSAVEAAQWSHLDQDQDGVACYGD